MGEEHIERVTWSGGRARLWRVRTDEELREIYKGVGILAHIETRDWNELYTYEGMLISL